MVRVCLSPETHKMQYQTSVLCGAHEGESKTVYVVFNVVRDCSLPPIVLWRGPLVSNLHKGEQAEDDARSADGWNHKPRYSILQILRQVPDLAKEGAQR